MKDNLNRAVYSSKRSAIREYSALAQATPGCIALTLGEPDFDSPAVVTETAIASLHNSETHYIENNGLRSLREKIAIFESCRNGMDYTSDEIILTAGATEALFVALFGILNPGDEVIIPTPAFVLYEEIIKLCRGVPVFLDTTEDDFQINREKLQALISKKTKAVILNSPNNPTGAVYSQESLKAVYHCVAHKPIFVICDDVYRQLVYMQDYHSFSEYRDLREQILLVQSFSKPYAMTGWRVGYLAGDRSIMEHLELVHQFNIVSTPAPFQKACIAALDFDPSVLKETYLKRRKYVLSRLDAMGLSYSVPDGAFYVFPSIEKFGIPSGDFCKAMIKRVGLAATPGYCFHGEGHIRLTYCYSDDTLCEGLNRLQRFIEILERERS